MSVSAVSLLFAVKCQTSDPMCVSNVFVSAHASKRKSKAMLEYSLRSARNSLIPFIIVPFPRHEITNTNPSHPIQKNQHKNTIPTTKKNINHRKILATHNRRHRKRRNQNPSPQKRNTRRNRNQKPHQNHKKRPLLRILGLLQTRKPPTPHKRTHIRSRNPPKRKNHTQPRTHRTQMVHLQRSSKTAEMEGEQRSPKKTKQNPERAEVNTSSL